jgi:cell division protein FtsB
MPGVSDSGDGGLRAVNTRLRELLAERDARIEEQAAENAALRELVTALQTSDAL